MKLLILGGTRFLGRHLAEQALQRGHQVTLLHRGRSGPGLFPEAQHLLADRDGDLQVLAGGRWDAAIDTSAYVPRQVRALGPVLGPRVGHYQLVSSISAYASFDDGGSDEVAPTATLDDPSTEAITGATYGGLKALCEQAAQALFGTRCLVNRPGLLVGPHDPTGRFTWWVQRLQRGGTVLAPGDPAAPVQFIDARDAAAWMLLQAEHATAGVFNLTGPVATPAQPQPLTMGAFLDRARATLNPGASLQWVGERYLLDEGVAPWSDLPVWLPLAQCGLHRTPLARAVATGLQTRPLAHTLMDTATWAAAHEAPHTAASTGPARPAVGLGAEREAALLAGWAARA
jgi:2'-hydroxyisoflavone reductase